MQYLSRNYSKLSDRILRKSLMSKVCSVQDSLRFFKDGQALGWSGFTPVGYPKAIPIALADKVEQTGEKMQFELFIGASVGKETEDRWASLNMIKRRWPYQTGKNIAKGINTGKIQMGDIHLAKFAQNLAFGFFTKDKGGKLDIALIEACEIDDEGIILAGSVGATQEICQIADKIIVEINTTFRSFRGLHDIEEDLKPPFRRPNLISRVDDRVGTTHLKVDFDKIVAIVESNKKDNGRPMSAPDKTSEKIADNILDFFQNEVKHGRLPKNLLPLQSGVGNIANAVVAGLVKGPFKNLNVWTEVLQDTMLDFFDNGKLEFATSTALTFTPDAFKRLYENWDFYAPKICLRPQQITNGAEQVRRLGVIAMNTPVEFDIYGHANSTLVGGTRMISGLGGSNDFLRNGYLTIMHAPSTRRTKVDPFGITSVVPMAPHVDHTEHDLDILVTEQGLADLRGLAPRQRAKEIINKCAHPVYKPILTEYYEMALKDCLARKVAHQPQLLDKCYNMQLNLAKNGTMRVNKW
ncbi:acetyl-coa hydrolase [Anaeramoeba flamelloides]|uniref:Acetyl-CoA hydrolase n=2 Tax=Anaeramoeba flamelloides TaxID=1746091 RepID=A0ABQ8XZC0_9EUKA|nr:acetyl-coa hydrolase [Anaeramoeba flamelloides]